MIDPDLPEKLGVPEPEGGGGDQKKDSGSSRRRKNK
jgi:hypothetical protein